MKRVVIDTLAYDGHPRAFPAHVEAQMRKAGFRLKPCPYISPTSEQVENSIEQPWRVTRSPLHVLTIEQGEPGSEFPRENSHE